MTVPGGSPPASGFGVFPYGSDPSHGSGSVSTDFTSWTANVIKGVLGAGGAVVGSFSNAQNTLKANITNPLFSNSTQIGNQSTTLSNHENRIVKLEDGTTIATFGTSDTWHKPSGYNWHQVHTLGGAAGGQRGESGGSQRTSQGAGRGGWDIELYAEATLIGSSYAVNIGAGGLGGGSFYDDGMKRANNLSLGSAWRTDSGTRSAQILAQATEAGPQTANSGENGYWHSYADPMLCDDVEVRAVLTAPVALVAQDNYTGVYLAAADSFSGSSILIAFVGSVAGGCGIISQTNAPSFPYIANGIQTGQVVLANTTTTFAAGQTIALRRVGNVFSGLINGVVIATWTDTGNTIPKGAGNRRVGMILEGNYPLYQNEFHSLAIADFTAINIDALPGSDTTFSGSGITTQGIGSGGSPGATWGATSPAAMGAGNTTTPVSGGGCGGDGTGAGATAGGDGIKSAGGIAGTSAGAPGHDGGNVPTGQYGPGGGGGGGEGASTSEGGEGGNGGYPSGPGGGGGSCPLTQTPGGGGNGSPGVLIVISSVTHP